MTDNLWERALGAVVAVIVAALGSTAPQDGAEQQAKKPRSSLAKKAEASAGQPLASPSAPVVRGQWGPVGRDISWPNCPVGMGIPARRTLGLAMPPAGSNYVIIGLTNGPGFYSNPCLDDQVAHAQALDLWTAAYAVVTYPTPEQLRAYGDAGPHPATTARGRLQNTGWAQAQYNIENMRAAGLESPIIWVDVEPVRPPAPWSTDTAANRAVLEGSMRAYRAAGFQLGVYSTAYLWESIVGQVTYGLPEWRAAGQTSKQRALAMCSSGEIQGGDAVMGQWVDDVDRNVLCPGRPVVDVLQQHFAPPPQ